MAKMFVTSRETKAGIVYQTIYKQKNPRGGYKVRKQSYPTERQAIEARDLFNEKLAVARNSGLPEPEIGAKNTTIGRAIEDYLVYYDRKPVRAKTKADVRVALIWLQTHLARWPLDRFTTGRAQTLMDELADPNHPLALLPSVKHPDGFAAPSRTYVGNLKRIYSAMWNWLVRSGDYGVLHNPWAGVEGYGITKRIVEIDDATRTALIEAARDDSEQRMYPILMLALGTGMRRGEIMSLTWGQVDFDASMIRLDFKGRKRSVAISPPVAEALTEHHERQRRDFAPHGTEDCVFGKLHRRTQRHQSGWRVPDFTAVAWNRVRKAAGYTGRFHDLRHDFARRWRETGEDMTMLQEQIGHSKVSTTLEFYAHLPDHVKHAKIRAGLAKIKLS